KVLNEGWDTPRVISYLKDIAYDSYKIYCVVVVINILSVSNTNLLDRLDAANSMSRKLRVLSLKEELELFCLRAYLWLTDYDFPYNAEKMLMSGGLTPYVSEVRKVR